MQAQQTQPGERSGAIGFAMPKHYRHASQDSAPLSTCGRASGLVVGGDLTTEDGHSYLRRTSRQMAARSTQESWAQGSGSSKNPPVSKGSSRRNADNEGRETAGSARQSDPQPSSTTDTPVKESRKPLPPRLSKHIRFNSNDSNLPSLSTVPDNTIAAPLVSPITATANSLTALSISQTPIQSGLSGRDLSKRERKKTRPAAEPLVTQDHEQSSQGEDHRKDQPSRASDSENTKKQDRGSTKQSAKEGSKTGHSSSSATSSAVPATSNGDKDKSANLKLVALKPTVHLRVTLYNLVSTGYLPERTVVVFREHSAIVTANGTLVPQLKEPDSAALYPWLQSEYETPSAWATAMVKGTKTGKVAVNGWSAIKVPIQQISEQCKMFDFRDMTEIPLDVLRKRYLADMAEDGSIPAESAPVHEKGVSAAERKKRKRHVTDSGKVTELRITTHFGAPGRGGTRPRKRTMSDLSGTAAPDLLRDRQLHLDAAGALFSMKDPFSPMTLSMFEPRTTTSKGGRQKLLQYQQMLPLESLARHRQEREQSWSHSMRVRPSALRVMKELALVPAVIPLSPSSSMEHVEFCLLCGALGQVVGSRSRQSPQSAAGYHWSSMESSTSQSYGRHGQDSMRRCIDCGECYHVDCIPSDIATDRLSSAQSDDSWCCPRCTICSYCQKMIHERPPLSAKESTSNQGMPATGSGDIWVLACDKCHHFTHVQCQLTVEPTIKEFIRSGASNNTIEWICFPCRECVECGYRVPTGMDVHSPDEEPAVEPSRNQSIVHGKWSHGSILCPNCTALAEKGNICPVCCRTYEDDDYETPMIFCDGCSLWVHIECDKGLKDRDYEELGEDSKQYFCPTCLPTPIPSPLPSPSSMSANSSAEQSTWQDLHHVRSQVMDSPSDLARGLSSVTEDDWSQRGKKRKDDILDLIKAAKEISDSESQANSPYSSYSPMFSSSRHSRTVSASLESVAEIAAAEALMTIYSGASTPVCSTPYTSYPSSPYETSFSSFYDRQYSVVSSPHDLPSLMRSLAFTASADQDSHASTTRDCLGTTNCRCHRHWETWHTDDYFNSRPRPKVQYYQLGQESMVSDSTTKHSPSQLATVEETDIVMDEAGAVSKSFRGSNSRDGRGTNGPPSPIHGRNETQVSSLYHPFLPHYRPSQEARSIDLSLVLAPLSKMVDTRECVFCHTGPYTRPTSQSKGLPLGRLLPIRWRSGAMANSNELSSGESFRAGWIHSQCALWSTGVSLDPSSGVLSNVDKAVCDSLHVTCSACGQPGASIKCRAASSKDSESAYACPAVFHLSCVNEPPTPQAFPRDCFQQRPQSYIKKAMIMDQKQRTILCPMHYSEVSTLKELRTASFALQPSILPPHSAMEGSRLDAIHEPAPSALSSLWQGPIFIPDVLLNQSNARQSVRKLSDGAVHGWQEEESSGFRIGGLVVHHVGSFEPPGPMYYETGLGNDIDLEIKYDAQLKRGNRMTATMMMMMDHPHIMHPEILALPLGYKCERRVFMDPNHSQLCLVTAEIIRLRYTVLDGEASKATTEYDGSTVSGHDANQDQTLEDMGDNDEVGLSWKITITPLHDDSASDQEHGRVFYSDTMRDVVETIFRPPANDSANVDVKNIQHKKYRRYLRVPSAFFGLDHPVIRETIRSLSGEEAVASRMWQRYQLNQKVAEQQCNEHGCFHRVTTTTTPTTPTTTTTTMTLPNAKRKQERSFERSEATSAARTRSWPQSRHLRKRIVRVGLAYGSGDDHDKGDSDITNGNNSRNGGDDHGQSNTGHDFMPGLSQDLTKAVVTTPASLLLPSSPLSTCTSLPVSAGTFPPNDRLFSEVKVTPEQLQKVRAEQSSNVTLCWNGRKVNTTTVERSLSAMDHKDSVHSAPDHHQDSKDTTDPKHLSSDTNMDIDSLASHPTPSANTDKAVPGTSRRSVDMKALPIHADLRVYATRPFEKDELILEYVGEVISPGVALRRQETYQGQGRGFYMMWCEFQEAVIDATHQGGVARHIRHEEHKDDDGGDGSVYARTVVQVGQSPKVVICAARRLKAGDELTMQYSSVIG